MHVAILIVRTAEQEIEQRLAGRGRFAPPVRVDVVAGAQRDVVHPERHAIGIAVRVIVEGAVVVVEDGHQVVLLDRGEQRLHERPVDPVARRERARGDGAASAGDARGDDRGYVGDLTATAELPA